MDNFFPSSGSNKKNRKILYGPSTTTWSVPSGTTEVDIHVWGGGGGGFHCTGCPSSNCGSVGGGGGGYARARVPVTDSDSLSIIVGGDAGTSSVSIPTQTPGSPMSATGGTNGGPGNYGPTSPAASRAGGVGAVILNPTFPTFYCFTASGGAGVPCSSGRSAGGSAGSPKGNGYDGFNGGGGGIGGQGRPQGTSPCSPNCPGTQGAGGDGGYSGVVAEGDWPYIYCCSGPGSYSSDAPNIPCADPSLYITCQYGNRNCCRSSVQFVSVTGFPSPTAGAPCNRTFYKWDYEISVNRTDDWFYVEDMEGAGGILNVDAGPGGGGGVCSRAGLLGGSGTTPTIFCIVNDPTSPQYRPGNFCNIGGCGGGSGANAANPGCCSQAVPTPGTPGVVIIYW